MRATVDRARAAPARTRGGRLVDALAEGEAVELSAEQRETVLDTTDGNPLFIEETMRMFVESGGEPTGIPPTVQAMIAARIDRLPAAERKVLRRAAVAGRTFWSGAVEAIGEDSDPVERSSRSSSSATSSCGSRAPRSAARRRSASSTS